MWDTWSLLKSKSIPRRLARFENCALAKCQRENERQKANTMKVLNTLSVAAAGVASCAVLCQPAFGAIYTVPGSVLFGRGTPALNQEYSSELLGNGGANAVQVFWEVTAPVAGNYTYMYAVINGYLNPVTHAFTPGTAGGQAGINSLSVLFPGLSAP